MAVKAWGPLFALLAILAASLTGMAVQYTHQNNQSKPAKSENGHGSDRKIVAVAAPEPDNAKAKEKHNAEEGFKATDWLLVLFNALLALYTWRLYRATSGLFTETAGLRDAAEKQRIDSLRSIVASETAAKAAQASAESLPILERAYVFLGADAKGVLMRDGRIESGVE